MDFSDLRRDFGKFGLHPDKMPENPVDMIKQWITQASEAGIDEFNAMVLSTVSINGKPSSRIVLLKEISDDNHLIFYTNYHSKKAKDIMSNPNAALNIFWREMERQIRIEGMIKKTSRDSSRTYFKSRPVESQLSAIVSPQSESIKDLSEIRKKVDEYFLSGKKISLPENWGGYELMPEMVEFWQGGKNRLHDRIRYSKNGHFWFTDRLAP